MKVQKALDLLMNNWFFCVSIAKTIVENMKIDGPGRRVNVELFRKEPRTRACECQTLRGVDMDHATEGARIATGAEARFVLLPFM